MDNLSFELLAMILKEVDASCETDTATNAQLACGSRAARRANQAAAEAAVRARIQNQNNMRLVCKKFRSAATREFARTLGLRKIRLVRSSLETLRRLSEDGSFAPYVTEICFSTESLYPDKCSRFERLNPRQWSVCFGPSLPGSTDMHTCVRMFEAQRNMDESGATTALLSEAFRDFPKLRTLSICRTTHLDTPLTFDALFGDVFRDTFYRPNQSAPQNGATSAIATEMDVIRKMDVRQHAPKRVLVTVHSAVMQANVPLQGFAIMDETIPDLTPDISQALLFSTLGRLQTLQLSFEDPAFVPANTLVRSWLPNWLHAAPALHTLDLSFSVRRHNRSISRPTDLLTACPAIPNLRSLALRQCSFRHSTLAAFLANHSSTLRSLVLEEPLPLSGTWTSVWKHMHQNLSLDKLELRDLVFSGRDRSFAIDVLKHAAKEVQYDDSRDGLRLSCVGGRFVEQDR